MEPDAFLTHLKSQLIGRKIMQCHLAANSLIILTEAASEEASGYRLWLKPTWNFVGRDGVLTGSRQAQHKPDAENPDAGCQKARNIVGTTQVLTIQKIAVEPLTFSLLVTLSDASGFRTFVSDPDEAVSWHIKENATGKMLEASPHGLKFVKA